MFLGCIIALISFPLLNALPEPILLAQQAFVLSPSCYFTWGRFFIGQANEVGTTGVVYTDAAQVCGLYTSNGETGAMVPAINAATSIFPMLQLCANTLIGWVSQTDIGSCTVMSGAINSANTGTLISTNCSSRFSAIFCYFPTATTTFLRTRTLTTTTTTTQTSFNLIPSFTSTTITALTSIPTTTVQTEFSTSQTFIITVVTSISSIVITRVTTATTSGQTTLTISDTILITTVFTFNSLSVSVDVPTTTETILSTTTATVCVQSV